MLNNNRVMPVTAMVEQTEVEQTEADAGQRASNWLGFLLASLAVNVLFVYGMLAGMGDATLAIWYKTLIWLPFNIIASALYWAIMVRLRHSRWSMFRLLCPLMIAANWSVMFSV
jgi:hypothetical protein